MILNRNIFSYNFFHLFFKLIKVFYEKRKIYLVMDLCTGGELYQYVANHEGEHLSEADAITLTIRKK